MSIKPAPRRQKNRLSNPTFALLLLGFVVLAALELKPKDPVPAGDAGLAVHFQGYEASFVLLDSQAGKYLRHDPARAAKRLTPMSTFKIANALVALDAGVAAGPDAPLKWDGAPWPWPAWMRDHTLASAMQESVVWYFQELARRVGGERMGIYLKLLDYGNADVSGGSDRFWLDSTLAISAEEQVRFLDLLARGRLPLGARAMEQARAMLELGKTDQATLYGKTGTRLVEGKATLGWFVGWLERGGRVYVFAANLAAAEGADGKKARAATEDILREKRLW